MAKRAHKRDRDQAPDYSFADVLRCTTATRSNLIHWTNIGIIKPDIEDTAGPGHPRRFSQMNLVEAELCAAVNRFRVPVTLVGHGAATFRAFHRRQLALTGPEVPRGTDLFTPEQARAFEDVVVDELRTASGVRPGSRDHHRQVLRARGGFSDEQQRYALKEAYAWERYRCSADFRHAHFCGLFVVPTIVGYESRPIWERPIRDHTHIAHDWIKPLDMNSAVSVHAIAINVARALNRVERATGTHL